jgi:hypothetical protein
VTLGVSAAAGGSGGKAALSYRRIARRRAGDNDIDPLLPCAYVSPHSAAVLLQVHVMYDQLGVLPPYTK